MPPPVLVTELPEMNVWTDGDSVAVSTDAEALTPVLNANPSAVVMAASLTVEPRAMLPAAVTVELAIDASTVGEVVAVAVEPAAANE
jgi:hypothetical protein